MTQAFNLSQVALSANSAGKIDASSGLVNATPLANGGTGVNNSTASSLLPKAWAFIAANGSVNAGIGITATNPSTGNYTVTFSTALTDANYCANITVDGAIILIGQITTKSAANCNITIQTVGGVNTNAAFNISVWR